MSSSAVHYTHTLINTDTHTLVVSHFWWHHIHFYISIYLHIYIYIHWRLVVTSITSSHSSLPQNIQSQCSCKQANFFFLHFNLSFCSLTAPTDRGRGPRWREERSNTCRLKTDQQANIRHRGVKDKQSQERGRWRGGGDSNASRWKLFDPPPPAHEPWYL